MVQMLRKEVCSGSIADLAHVRTEFCLSDCLTKATASPDVLVRAVETGQLPMSDCHPLFRTTLPHKAYQACESMTSRQRSDGFPLQRNRDYWQHTGSTLKRIHVVPRRALFVPACDVGEASCPVDVRSLDPSRCTHVSGLHGGQQDLTDTWTAHQSRRALAQLWTGETVFHVGQSTEPRRVSFGEECQSCEE